MRRIFFLNHLTFRIKIHLRAETIALKDNFDSCLTEAFFSSPVFFFSFYSEVDFTSDHWNY